MQSNAPAIANDFEDGSDQHGYCVTPSAVTPTEETLGDKTDEEDNDEDSIGRNVWQVVQIAPSDYALVILCAVIGPYRNGAVVCHGSRYKFENGEEDSMGTVNCETKLSCLGTKDWANGALCLLEEIAPKWQATSL